MIENSIIINQSGMDSNTDWMHEGVYLNYCFSEKDYFYVGESKCYGKRSTSYSSKVINMMCKYPDTSRSLFCYWKSDIVNTVLASINKEYLMTDNKKPLRKLLEGSAMSHFMFDTYLNKCNTKTTAMSIDEMKFGIAIIIFSRKYPIHKSIYLANDIYVDLSLGEQKVLEKETDPESIIRLKREYNDISSEFYKYLSKGLVIAQQGYKRKYPIISDDEKYLLLSNNLDVFFGQSEKFFENYKMLINNKFIRLYQSTSSTDKFLVHIRNYYIYQEDLVCSQEDLNNIYIDIGRYLNLSTDIKEIIENSINFLPIM